MGANKKKKAQQVQAAGEQDAEKRETTSSTAAAGAPAATQMPVASPAASGVAWSGLTGYKLSPLSLSFLQDKLKFPTTTPVQARTIPLLLTNKDVVVEAMTGSGKTLAYLVPAMEMMLSARGLQAWKVGKNIVLCAIILPSRELALQVSNIAKLYIQHVNNMIAKAPPSKDAKDVKFTTACFIGGRDIAKDIEVFTQGGANVLIGTPGRLFELLVSSKHATAFDVSRFELLVLDEADKLLEFGFKAKLDSLLKRLPKQRRTGLFSATQTRELGDIARTGMRNAVAVTVRQSNAHALPKAAATSDQSKPQVPEQLENFYLVTKMVEKHDYLAKFLTEKKNDKILVYVLTCAAVDWLALALPAVLASAGGDPDRKVLALHGQMPLGERTNVTKAFRSSSASNAVMVCTDVAARGLDIPEVGIVVQFEAPVAPSTFVHRIGRTARMGRAGMSLLFMTPQETEYIEFMKLQNIPLHNLVTARGGVEEESSDDEDEENDVSRTLESARPILKGKGRGYTKQLLNKSKQADAADIAAGRKRPREGGERKEVNKGELPTESPAILAIRRAAVKNPKITELALRAFVSFLRAYKEHECRYIFQLKKIDIIQLVHFFGLFSVPSCGELRRMGRLFIPLQPEFDEHVSKLRSEAKARTQERLKAKVELQKKADEGKLDNRNKSIVTQTGERKEVIKGLRISQKQQKEAWKQADIDELMRESYLVKKEKFGRISKRRVDELAGDDAIENVLLSSRERAQKKKQKSPHAANFAGLLKKKAKRK